MRLLVVAIYVCPLGQEHMYTTSHTFGLRKEIAQGPRINAILQSLLSIKARKAMKNPSSLYYLAGYTSLCVLVSIN